MDQLLQMIQSADPTDNQSDSVELLQLEGKEISDCIIIIITIIMHFISLYSLI